ncbi:hypothetical protein QTG54_009912 [Skeletonema marinoi]|uniref:Uncharacterized protein n=1 Tax=Skeletonema marinoi TaxID=267567 RepID=A0AAD8Y5E8_9STRA|nr:hypothetical protein QTG54_009912 [Skeletonema marinoi]
MRYLTNIVLLLSACASVAAAAAADGDWKLRPSTLIATTIEIDRRQLGGSKSSKRFFAKESKSKGRKSSSGTASRSRQSTKSAKFLTANNRDSSDDNRIKSTSQENSSFQGSLFEGANANLITPSSSPLGSGVPIAGQDDFFSRTNSDTDEETRTNFLEIEDNGDYSGLRTQNMVVGIASLFALLAAIVGVAVMRKRRANADTENNILDSVEIAPVVTAVRPNRRPPSNSIVAPVDDTDYSCDLFGFKDCLA